MVFVTSSFACYLLNAAKKKPWSQGKLFCEWTKWNSEELGRLLNEWISVKQEADK